MKRKLKALAAILLVLVMLGSAMPANAERGSIVTTNAMRAIIASARLSRVFMCIPHYRLFAAMQSMAHYHANR